MFLPAASTVVPDPARFFAPEVLSKPLPTNSFFQNFALNNGDMPEYIHPYLIRSAADGPTVCYPRRSHSASSVVQNFVADLTVSSPSPSDTADAQPRHRIAAFDDLSVTLDVSPSLRAFLVRGSPFVTVSTTAGISITTSAHAFVDAAPCDRTRIKWRLRMTSGQTFFLYADAPIQLSQSGDTKLSSACGFSGVVLYHDPSVRVLKDFRYRSIDGDLVGVVGNSWFLNPGALCRCLSPTWHAKPGYIAGGVDEIVAALRKDVDGLASCPITTTSCYLYGKAIARAARLAVIAEEVRCPDVIPEVRRFLRAAVTPWLDGSFQGNGFLYESQWGGLVTRQPAGADGRWGGLWFRDLQRSPLPAGESGARCTRLRNFDLWKLHSWASGLTESADGRTQERTDEAVNAYYSAKLLGLSYKDSGLITAGTTLTAFEILAAHTWWHAPKEEGAMIYDDEFSSGTRVVHVVWANRRDGQPSSCPPERRLGVVQFPPLLPITQALFSDTGFVRELVEYWSTPAASSSQQGVGEGWKGFVYALEGIYDKDSALEKARALTAHDDGDTQTNLLWWLHSRHPPVGEALEWLTLCLFRPQPVDALVRGLLERPSLGAGGHA
ncbi:unnamed protein product [Alopecurus aequalis]